METPDPVEWPPTGDRLEWQEPNDHYIMAQGEHVYVMWFPDAPTAEAVLVVDPTFRAEGAIPQQALDSLYLQVSAARAKLSQALGDPNG